MLHLHSGTYVQGTEGAAGRWRARTSPSRWRRPQLLMYICSCVWHLDQTLSIR